MSEELRKLTCAECGVAFFVDDDLFLTRRRFKRPIYCPNGHLETYVLREDLQSAPDTRAADQESKP